MKRLLDVLRRIRFPNLGALRKMKLPSLAGIAAKGRRLSARQIILWGGSLLVAGGLFVSVRGLTACWRLTAMPGIPPANCAGAAVNPLSGTPSGGNQSVPITGVPPTPDVGLPEVTYPKWDGGSRINIAFFGLRGGETAGEGCPLCTDTIIVFTVDPVSMTAGMISVPRDLYVNIPGSEGCSSSHDGYCRINTAWTTGEALKLPGGGPAEAMKTVSLFLGVPIQYYVQVDFDTFTQLIDLIHGVDIYNDENLVLDRLGSGTTVTVAGSAFGGGQNIAITFDGAGVATAPSSCRADAGGSFSCAFNVPAAKAGPHEVKASDGTRNASGTFTVGGGPISTPTGAPAATAGSSISLSPASGFSASDKVNLTCCGMRHLTGPMALAYARGRHTANGDVDRSRRQQKLIIAIRNKVFNAKNFPMLMAEAPQLYNTFQAGIHTNMSIDDAIKLAALVKGIPVDRIQPALIDDHMVNFGNVTLGGQNAAVLLPIPDKIRELRDQIFTTGGPTSPIAQGDPRALMQADGARVQLINDTYTQGLEQRTGNFLVGQGMQNIVLGQPTGALDQTVVVVYSPKLYALRYLFGIGMISSGRQIIFKPDATSPVDLEIRLGNDWVSKLPAGN
jgi:LCP family protein required for cell wall assembly